MKAKSTAILLDDTEKVVARMMISRSDIIEEHTEVTLGRFEIQVEGLIDTLTGNNENETQLKSSVLGAPNVASKIDYSSSSSDTRAPLHPIGRVKAFVQPDRLGSAAARVSAFRPPASSSSSSSRAGIKHKTSPPQMNNGNKRARVLGSDDSDGGEDEDENEGELIWTSMVVAGAPLVPSPPPPAKPIVAVPFIAPGSALVNEGIATGASASSSASSSAMDVGPPRLDPSLARLMRPHQVEAATTLIGWLSGAPRIPALPSSSDDLWASASSCGRQEDSGAACDSECHYQGAILADDMGLGKTLTAIAVLWTFLRSFTAKGVVVVPASIVGNWSNELKRWLSVRLVPLVLKTSKDIDTLSAFKSGHPAVTPLLIISYDLFRTHIAEINEVKSLDMIVLDEGHKFLKNAGTKTSAALARCRATKRLVLTGTPLQNNLSELHAVCSFVAPPSLLGALSTFNSRYAHTIAAGLKPGACTAATREANRTARALARKLDTIMIRRTADQVEGGHVPGRVRHDATILCRLSKEQHDIYEDLTRRCLSAFSDKMHVLVDGADSEQDEDSGAETDTHLVDACNPLSVMQRLRAICCSAADAPPSDETSLLNMSSKLTVLDHFLRTLQHRSPREKVVVVSNFTAALDHVQGLADARGYDTLRLDGRVPKDKRQGLVDRFNRPGDSSFLFLLSSKVRPLFSSGPCTSPNPNPNPNPNNPYENRQEVWASISSAEADWLCLIATGTRRQTYRPWRASIVKDSSVIVLCTGWWLRIQSTRPSSHAKALSGPYKL